MTSQILIKQDFDNYSEKFSFARRRVFLAELISTVTILESAIYYWTWTLPMMTSTSMRNNFCQEPETHTEQEGKGNLLIKLHFFFLHLILKEYGSLNLLQLQKETSSHHHHHSGVGLPSCSDYRRQTRSLLSSEIAVSLDWLFPSPIPRKPSVGVSSFHNFSTLFP